MSDKLCVHCEHYRKKEWEASFMGVCLPHIKHCCVVKKGQDIVVGGATFDVVEDCYDMRKSGGLCGEQALLFVEKREVT